MLSSSRKRAKLVIAAAAYVLVSFVALGPNSAQAGCGHGVTSETNRSAQGSISDLELFTFSEPWLGGASPTPHGRNSPCAGATCSQERNLPRAPALASSSASDLFCIMIAAFHSTRPDFGDLAVAQFTPRPRSGTLPIDRPPRDPRSPAVF